MFGKLRFGAMVVAALGLSSIAPAQVGTAVSTSSEPRIAANEAAIPAMIRPDSLLSPSQPIDEIVAGEPAVDGETPAEAAKPDRPTGNLSSLVAQLRSSAVPSRELECLAGAIYFESKSEPLAGQLAVGQVVANRAKSGRFASSYCGVVFQRGQFSFVRGRALPAIPRASPQWKTAVAIAQIVDQALHVSAVPKALFFHARRVSPRWRLTRLGAVGNHVFYR